VPDSPVPDSPVHVIASVAVSLDGCIDDAGPGRLVLSSPEDLDRVDAVRAGVDAILVGAGTVRADDPRLQVRSAQRRADRVARGEPDTPLRVVLAGRRGLDPAARVFDGGGALVLRDPGGVDAVLAALAARGVRRLLVEGGTAVHTAFLAADAVDELHLAVAPVLVGHGPRFVHPAAFPQGRLRLVGAGAAGDTAVLRYARAGPG
jgi:5-amino-6-(5-phosphoribosylamino)uracil reductase